MMQKNTQLIVIEGIDGVGKTTLTRGICTELQNRGIKAVLYEDIENKTEGFNTIKKYVKEHVSVEASFYFYLASAIHKSNEIEQLLKDNWVICDRYVFSTYAFHVAQGLSLESLPDLKNLSIRMPDQLILLVLDEGERNKRISERAHNDIDDCYPNVPGSYLHHFQEILKSFNPKILDANSSKEALVSVVIEAI